MLIGDEIMNIEIKVNILPWNEFKFEYKTEELPEDEEEITVSPTERTWTTDIGLDKMSLNI